MENGKPFDDQRFADGFQAAKEADALKVINVKIRNQGNDEFTQGWNAYLDSLEEGR